MSAVLRAWRYVTRQRVRSLVILLVLFVTGSVLMSAVAVGRATDAAAREVSSSSGAGVRLGLLIGLKHGTPRGGGDIPRSVVEQVAALPQVGSHLYRQTSVADLIGAKAQALPGASHKQEKDDQFANTIGVEGVSSSEKHTGFRTELLSLSAGRHLNESDHHAALVHESLAEANNLKVGDTLKLRRNTYDADNTTHSSAEVSVTIVGLIHGDNLAKATVQADLFANTVLTDLDTTRDLNGWTKDTEIYHDAFYFTANGVSGDELLKAVNKLRLDPQHYDVKPNSSYLAGITWAIDGIRSLVRTLVIATMVVGAAVLSLVLVLWVRERRRETGVLLALGTSKAGIVTQYLTELVLLAVPALGLSFLGARALAQGLGDRALSSATRSALQELSKMGQLGADIETSQVTKTLNHLTVAVDSAAALQAGGLVLAVIVLCAVLSALPVLTRSPRSLIGAVS